MIAACAQMEATTMDQADGVWMNLEVLAAKAAEASADLLVLPELVYPAYFLESTERYMQPDIERSEKVLERLSKLAKKHGFWLVSGFVEECEGRLYNSAVVFDRKGSKIGTARKNFLWDCDHQWFTPGESLTVIETEFGGMGVLICADARVPEIPATLVTQGAQFIVQPTAWVNTSNVRRTYRNIQPDFLIRSRAMEFGTPFICCSKAGREGSVLEFIGLSQMVSAEGGVLAQAPLGGDHLITAEVSPADPHTIDMDDETRRRLLSSEPPFRPEQPGQKCTIRLRENADSIALMLESVGARPARMKVGELSHFGPARRHALDGAAVLVVEGRVMDDAMIRTRAAENRVFVIAASDMAQFVVDPDGNIAWRKGDWQDKLELDLASADLKQFNPHTDLWAQRRVESYRLMP